MNNMNLFWKIWDGEVGVVVEGDDWNEERKCICIDGVDYKLVDDGEDIDEWMLRNEVDLDKLMLFRSEGYRGVGCYNGYYKLNDGSEWSFDFVSDGVVYRIEKKKK
jgi:hypothetical protein